MVPMQRIIYCCNIPHVYQSNSTIFLKQNKNYLTTFLRHIALEVNHNQTASQTTMSEKIFKDLTYDQHTSFTLT